MTTTILTSVRLEQELASRLADLAKQTGRSKAYYIQEAVRQKLEDMEDIYLSLQRLEKKEKMWSLDEVEREIIAGKNVED